MNDDQFMKLFRYIEDFRNDVNQKFEKTASQDSLDSLINTIDTFVGRLDDSDIEQTARDAQFNRLVEWPKKVSEKTSVPLPDF